MASHVNLEQMIPLQNKLFQESNAECGLGSIRFSCSEAHEMYQGDNVNGCFQAWSENSKVLGCKLCSSYLHDKGRSFHAAFIAFEDSRVYACRWGFCPTEQSKGDPDDSVHREIT